MKQPPPALGKLAQQVFVQIQPDAYRGEVNASVVKEQRVMSNPLRVCYASVGNPICQKNHSVGCVSAIAFKSFMVAEHQSSLKVCGTARLYAYDQSFDDLFVFECARGHEHLRFGIEDDD